MTRSLRSLIAVACVAVLAAVAAAAVAAAIADEATPATPEADTRYSYHRADDGFVRLDQRTGQVSLCAHRSTGWSCQAMPDDRAAFEAEIARLTAENAALKKELIDRGLALPPAVKAEPSPPNREGTLRLPNETDLDHMLTFIEKVWRRFVEIIDSARQDEQRKI